MGILSFTLFDTKKPNGVDFDEPKPVGALFKFWKYYKNQPLICINNHFMRHNFWIFSSILIVQT